MKRLAIFDLDGTLIDSIEDLTLCVNAALSEFNIPPVSKDNCRDALGHGAYSLIKDCLISAGTEFKDEDINKILSRYNDIYRKSKKENTLPYKGIIKMLNELRELGYTMAIVSNKPHEFTVDISKKLFGDLVGTIYGNRPDFPRKPDPSLVHHVIYSLGYELEEAIYIGDSDVDIICSRNAGIYSIAVSWGYRSLDQLQNEHPQFIAHTVSELNSKLQDLYNQI